MSLLDPATEQALIKDHIIPIQPQILEQLTAEFSSTSPDIKKITSLIEQDVSCIAGLLVHVYSQEFKENYSGVVPAHMSHITDLVKIAGLPTVQHVVEQQVARAKDLSFDSWVFERFWDSSKESAKLAKHLARELAPDLADEAYLVGLFRDIAIPLLLESLTNYMHILKEANEHPEKDLIELEEEAYFLNHLPAGYCITRAWHLPNTVSYAILTIQDLDALTPPQHHDGDDVSQELQEELTLQKNVLVAIAHLAITISDFHHKDQRSDVTNGSYDPWPSLHPLICKCLNKSEKELHDLMSAASKNFQIIVS